MRTGGYDVLVEVNERLLNRALAAAYHASFFSRFRGSIVPRSPVPFTGLARVDYDIWLRDPPLIDFAPKDLVRVRLSLTIVLTVAGRVRIPIDVAANLLAKLVLDQRTRTVSIEFMELGAESLRVLGRRSPPRFALSLANQALSLALRSDLAGEIARAAGLTAFRLPASSLLSSDLVKVGKDIPVALFPGFPGVALEVPPLGLPLSSMIPGELIGLDRGGLEAAVTAGHFGLVNRCCLAAGISFRDETVGDPRGIKDFIGDGDVAVGLSEASICRILDDVWPSVRTTVRERGRIEVEDVRELLNSLRGLYDLPSALSTMGLRRRTTKVSEAWVDYDALVTPDKPHVRLGKGGRIEIFDTAVDVVVKATAKSKLVTTTSRGVSPFLPAWMGAGRSRPEPQVTERESVLYEFEQCLHVDIKRAVAELRADHGRLTVKVVDVDFDMKQICLAMPLPKFILDTVSNMIERRIKGGFPPVDVTSLLQDRVLSKAPLGMDLRMREVSSDDCELVIVADLAFRDVPDTVSTVPHYIADSRSCRVHRADCPSLAYVRERDKVGYTSLYMALSRGYLGADDCLFAYASGLDGDSAVDLSPVNLDLSRLLAKGEQLSHRLAQAAERCVPPAGPPAGEKASSEKAGQGAVDEVERKEDLERPAGPGEQPIPIAGPECPGPVDGEADKGKPPQVARQVDRHERGDDGRTEAGRQDDQ